MSKRRQLGAALDISPEQRAFISGVPIPAKSVEATPIVLSETHAVQELEPTPALGAEAAVSSVEPQQVKRRARHQRRNVEESSFSAPMANLLAPLTTRLSPSTAAALKRAGLEQKLYDKKPSTVQEIVECAVREWLTQEGYL